MRLSKCLLRGAIRGVGGDGLPIPLPDLGGHATVPRLLLVGLHLLGIGGGVTTALVGAILTTGHLAS